jgi:hypothetical protein
MGGPQKRASRDQIREAKLDTTLNRLVLTALKRLTKAGATFRADKTLLVRTFEEG